MKSSEEAERVKVEPGSVVVLSDFRKKPDKRECGSRDLRSRVPNELRSSGRPNCLSVEKLEELLSVYYSKPYSLRRLAEMFGVSRMTVWRAVQENQGYLLTA